MGMNVTRIADGLWRWSSDAGGATIWSTYVEAPDAVVVIDPRLPVESEEADRFWTAFDRDVERRGHPVRVLLTGDADIASVTAFRERHDASVGGATGSRADGITPVADGTSPAAGVVCRTLTAPTGDRRGMYLLHDHAAVVIGDFPEAPEHRRTLVTHVIDSTNLRAQKTGETPTTFRWLLSSIDEPIDLDPEPAG